MRDSPFLTIQKRRYLKENEKNALNLLIRELLDENILQVLQNVNLQLLLEFLKKDKKADNGHAIFIMPKTAGDMCFVKLLLDDKLTGAVGQLIKKLDHHFL